MAQSQKLLESRRAAYRRQLGICFWCGKAMSKPMDLKTNSATADHLILRSKGGSLDRENIVCACSKCNNERGDKPLFQWLCIIFPRVSTLHFEGILQYLATCGISLAIGHPAQAAPMQQIAERPPRKDPLPAP